MVFRIFFQVARQRSAVSSFAGAHSLQWMQLVRDAFPFVKFRHSILDYVTLRSYTFEAVAICSKFLGLI